MPHKDDLIRIRHMLDAAKEAADFAQGKTKADLQDNRMLLLALVRSLEVIGEAASKVSEPFRHIFPEIAWADAVGMRNRLIHAYFDISLGIIWRTVQEDLPPLISALEGILASEFARSNE